MSGAADGLAGLSTEQLRAEVRAVLRDVLPAALTARGDGTTAPVVAPGTAELALRNDADLDAFVRRLAALCEDPQQRAALREGRHGFRLAVVDGAAAVAAEGAGGGAVLRVDRGAVTERTVAKAAAQQARLVLGRKAVLTPLARDKARTLGVDVEREH